MKKGVHIILIILGLAMVSFSCNKNTDNPKAYEGNRVAILQIDYETFVFEGGIQLVFDAAETFTISGNFDPPSDFGSVQFYYEELNELIFDGSIVWSGSGGRSFPETLLDPASFPLIASPLVFPDSVAFEDIFISYGSRETTGDERSQIWEAIDQLDLVEAYQATNPAQKIGIYCYRPSVGIGDPAEWDWIVILKN